MKQNLFHLRLLNQVTIKISKVDLHRLSLKIMHLVCYFKILTVLKIALHDLKSSFKRFFLSYPQISPVDPSLKIIQGLNQSGAVLPTFRSSFASFPFSLFRNSVKRLVNYVRIEVSGTMDTTTNHKF